MSQSHKRALALGRAHLTELLGVRLLDGWPEFPEAFTPSSAADAKPGDWPGYFFIATGLQVLAGNGGFAGAPNDSGEIEIGYEIAPELRNRGFATAAAQALVNLAFAQPQILAVVAHTLAEENASTAVLRKLGFSAVAELPNAEVGAVWRWRLAQPAYS